MPNMQSHHRPKQPQGRAFLLVLDLRVALPNQWLGHSLPRKKLCPGTLLPSGVSLKDTDPDLILSPPSALFPHGSSLQPQLDKSLSPGSFQGEFLLGM